jgi:hypothetical protein
MRAFPPARFLSLSYRGPAPVSSRMLFGTPDTEFAEMLMFLRR